MPESSSIDTRQVRRNFARAAKDYDRAAFLAREVDRRMLERLDYVKIAPKHIIDLGCGTGGTLTALKERYPKARLSGIDASRAMLEWGRKTRNHARWLLPFLRHDTAALVCADAACLPLPDACADFVWSNQMLHWCDPLPVFREVARVLAPGGLFMFSTLGPDTLKELRAAFAESEGQGRGGPAHTQGFVDMHDLGDMLLESGYAGPVMDMEVLTLTYPGWDELLRELRGSGGACAMSNRPRGLMGKTKWRRMLAAYERLRQEGRLPVSLEVIYGHAWKAEDTRKEGADRREGERQVVRFFDRRGGPNSSV
ncbi:MAG: methyltransferase domain-containing protein [Betaproteobacteria bacterium]|nr:methyltransferase domain-containing protein [Betaproteobacteria bacterium]